VTHFAQGRRRGGRAAFTLVELLVSSGLILLLTGILLPALAPARRAARSVDALAGVRDACAMVHAYASEFDGLFPQGTSQPWLNTTIWTRAMRRAGFVALDTDLSVTLADADSPIPLVLSAAVVMDPAQMRLGQTVPSEQARCWPVRTGRVASPAGKGLLYASWGTPIAGRPWCCDRAVQSPVAFIDGSAANYAWTDLVPGGVLQVQDNVGYPVYSTWNGVEGRDR